MMKNQTVRIIIAIISGIFVSVILSSIMIFIGYFQVNRLSLPDLNIKLFGLSIYQILKVDNQYMGKAITQNMVLIGVSFSVFSIIIIECITYYKNKSKQNKG